MEEKLKYDLDLEQFWRDDELAHRDNCFFEDAPQIAFGITMGTECIFPEIGVHGDPWGDNPPGLVYEYACRYNDKAEKIIGKRIMSEVHPMPHEKFPAVKLHGEVFGGEYMFRDGVYWLRSDINTPQALEKMLDKVERMNLREFILPPNWDAEKKHIFETTGETPDPYWFGRRVRGPVTLAMSIYGEENMVYLIYDEPELAHRFFDTISDVLISYADIMAEEAGKEKMNSRHWGYRFNDDLCYMMPPDMYEEYAYPILKRVFEHTCPDPLVDSRYQHSDSEMSHLLPILGKLDFMGVNFGPTVLLDKIRKYMPRTRVDGCLNPMTLLSNDEEKIIAEVRRDCEIAKALGTRGLNIGTAGSVNFGTKLTSIRAVMYAIQKYGRYE